MKDRWEELLAVLSKMLSIYQAILTLSKKKHDILVAAKPHELEIVTKQEELLIVQIGKLEDLRGKIMDEMMAAHGMKDGEVSLAELKKIAPPAVVEQIEYYGKEFGSIMTEMVPINKLNTELIKQALGFINYNINLLSQTAVGTTYAAKGQTTQEPPKRTAFDARV
ncbi:MAG: FlgN protein [Firmicutes bacterium]|nr:FlgN protein [Bacillota bacterium]